MSECEFRSAPLPVKGNVVIKDTPCVNDSGRPLILCQALISLAPVLNFEPNLRRVVCGLLEFVPEKCPVYRYKHRIGARDFRGAHNDYIGLVRSFVAQVESKKLLEVA